MSTKVEEYLGWTKGLFGSEEDRRLSSEEITALIKYASERGIGSEGLLGDLSDALYDYEIAENQKKTKGTATRAVLANYSKLCQLTNGVTGKSVVEGRQCHRHLITLYAATILFLVLGIFTEAVGQWLLDQPTSGDTAETLWGWTFAEFHTYVLTILGPFFWGGLGSCSYLLKRVSDAVASFRFDLDRYPGWQTRVLLGSVLGGTVAYLFEPAFEPENATLGIQSIGPNVFAFLAGLGTKIVYGGLEKIVESLAEKMELGKLRPRPRTVDEEMAFLTRELARTDPTTEEDKYTLIVELLGKRSGGKSEESPEQV